MRTIDKEKLISFFLISGWIMLVFIKIMTASAVIPGILWMMIGCCIILFLPKLRFNLTIFQFMWLTYITVIMASCITGPMMHREHGGIRKYDVLFTFLIPCSVAFIGGARGIQKHFFKYYRNVMVVFSIAGIFEYITHMQLYSFLIRTEAATYNFQFYSNPASSVYRLIMIFYHPIYYAVLMSFAIVCVLYIPFKKSIVNWAVVLMMIFNILLTQSRTGWLLIVIIFILHFLKAHPPKLNGEIVVSRKMINTFFIGSGILIISCLCFIKSDLFVGVREIMINRFNAAFVDQNYGARLSNFSLIGKISAKYGKGFYLLGGGFKYALVYLQEHPTVSGWTRAIDNQYISALIDTGVLGLMLYLSLPIFCVIGLIKNDWNDGKLNDIPYLIGILFFIASFSFDTVNANIVYYFVIIAFGSIHKTSNKENSILHHLLDRIPLNK